MAAQKQQSGSSSNTNSKRIQVNLSTELVEWVDVQAEKEGMSRSALIERLITQSGQNGGVQRLPKDAADLLERLRLSLPKGLRTPPWRFPSE